MARGEGSDETPSRRHPGRPGAVTYRVRVDLEETSPPLWRRLELASDLYLDEVHAGLKRHLDGSRRFDRAVVKAGLVDQLNLCVADFIVGARPVFGGSGRGSVGTANG